MSSHADLSGPTASDPTEPSGGLSHDALLYGSDEEYVEGVAAFVREGLGAGEPVSVITGSRNLGLVRDALGPEAAMVTFTDHAAFDLTPARKIALLQETWEAQAAAGVSRVRIVGEADFGQTTKEQLDWSRYEAILNPVFAHASHSFLCAYDRRRLPEWVIETAARTHPHLRVNGVRKASHHYAEPVDVARELAPPPPEADGEPALDLRIDAHGLASARGRIAALARQASDSRERADEITVGLNEIVTNALEHGSQEAHVRCWRDDCRIVCQVVDEGPGLDDPLAGYRPPAPDQLGGRGLWLARQTLDAVELRADDGAGLRAHLAATL